MIPEPNQVQLARKKHEWLLGRQPTLQVLIKVMKEIKSVPRQKTDNSDRARR